MFKFSPDLVAWSCESRGVYVKNDGLSMVKKEGGRWVPYVRAEVSEAFRSTGFVYLALHAAQDCCRRSHSR